MTKSGEGPIDSATKTAAELFEVLWTELVTVIGTAAAATLVRRAAKLACARRSELCELRVEREGWQYRYRLPAGWERQTVEQAPAFSELVQTELVPLLREFTGEIVLRRLARLPGLELPAVEEP